MPAATPSRSATTDALFAEVLECVARASHEELPALIGRLAELQAHALTRLQASPPPNPPAGGECLLDVEETARRLGCSRDWLYDNWRRLPFARREDYGLRFLESELNSYLRRK